MIYDKNMSIKNVLRMAVYLIGSFDRAQMRERLISTVKHTVKNNYNGKAASYNFDKQDLWESFFMKDDAMRRIIENRRIASIDELEMRTWEYVEKNRGKIKDDLF